MKLLESEQICCSHIYKKNKAILLVIRTEESFQFLCGDVHDYDDEPELMKLEDIIKYDPSIKNVLGLKKNHEIERKSINDLWTLKYNKDNDD